MNRLKIPGEEVKAFRHHHNLILREADQLMGYTSKGDAWRRWERVGAPYYASVIFKLIDAHGIDFLKAKAKAGIGWTPRDQVYAFRERHGSLTAESLDRLFGMQSGGRATRRWQEPLENGAPSYVTVMMLYADEFGWEVFKEMADALDERTS